MSNIQPFIKMHSNGNDFVIVDQCDTKTINLKPDWIPKIANRHRGIGFDQLLILKSLQPGHYAFDIWNADGSTASQCINGLRCLGLYILTRKPQKAITITNGHDVFQLSLHHQVVHIALKRDTTRHTVQADTLTIGQDVIAVEWVQFTNPHAIICVPDIMQVQFAHIVSAIHSTGLYPDGINITCYTEQEIGILQSRTFERGAGETQACGSAACALAMSYHQKNTSKNWISITQPGGIQKIRCKADIMEMTGLAVEVFSGSIQLPLTDHT